MASAQALSLRSQFPEGREQPVLEGVLFALPRPPLPRKFLVKQGQ